MNTRCPTCGSSSPSKVMKAAFGVDVPEDDDSTDPSGDASDSEPKGKLAGKAAADGEAGKPSFAERMANKYRSMHR